MMMIAMPMPRPTATVMMMIAMPMPRRTATVMPRLTAIATLATGIGLATAYRGSDMAATAQPVSAMEVPVSAMEGVTVADTSEQDTEEPEQPCMEPAWGAVNICARTRPWWARWPRRSEPVDRRPG
jgi:hypothetical protein